MINIKTCYHDICTEIDILEMYKQNLENQVDAAYKVVWIGKAPSDRTVPCFVPLDTALFQLDSMNEKLAEVTETLQAKYIMKQQIEMKVSQFEGIEYKVAYMRDIKGMHLDEIANELGYSYDWIRRISSKVNRMKEKIPS